MRAGLRVDRPAQRYRFLGAWIASGRQGLSGRHAPGTAVRREADEV